MGGEVIELAHWVEDATIKEDWGRTRPLQENPRLCMEGPPPQALRQVLVGVHQPKETVAAIRSSPPYYEMENNK
jgi:hypothetical protein